MAVRPLKITVVADARQAQKELSGFGSRLKGALGGAAALVGFAGITAGIKSVVSAASDAQQSVGATQAVYGKYAGQVIKDSKKAADSVGLSANAYREVANVAGSLLSNAGIPIGKTTKMTEQLTKRASDMAAVFGGTVSDAMNAMTSALKGEFDPIEQYGVSLKQSQVSAEAWRIANVKSLKDFQALPPAVQNAAQKQAAYNLVMAQSSKTAGQFQKQSGTLAEQQQILGAKLDNVKAKIGSALLPVMSDLADWATREVVPALEDFATWLEKNKGQIEDTASAIGQKILPPLKSLADLVIGAAKAFAALPGPVKEFGVEVGIAALVLPKLSSAMTVAGTGLANFSTKVKGAQMNMATLGRGLTTIAGVGGMVALQAGATKSNKALTTLGAGLTGAALGAELGTAVFPGVGTAVGGIIGAAGGAGIALWKMHDAEQASGDAASTAKPKFDDWRSTLDQTTGAFTRSTRAMVLQKLQADGVIQGLQQLGISTRDAIGATLGNAGAQRRVAAATKGNVDILRALTNQKVTDWIYGTNAALRAQQSQLRQDNHDLTTWKQALKGIPKKVFTKLEQLNFKPSMADVRSLKKQYDLTPHQVRTIIKQTGVEPTKKQVQGLQNDLKNLGNVKPSGKWAQLYLGDLNGTRPRARAGVEGLNKELRDGTGRARPNLGPFTQFFTSGLTGLKGTASSGGHAIGSDLSSGVEFGIATHAADAASAALVNNAIASARAAARSHSPSRETMDLGKDMGDGLVIGLRKTARDAKKGGESLAQAVRDGVRNGTSGVGKALDRISALIRKSITGKGDEKRENALIKRLKGRYDALRKNAKAQDALNKKLDDARQKLKDAVQAHKDYAAAIKQTITDTGNVTSLGQQEDGSVSITSLLDQLKVKVQNARRFADLIQTLQKKGLDRTAIQQMLDAGPEAALATAEAIASGGQDAVDQINKLQSQLANTGTQLGDAMADKYYNAGIKAAEGIVKGLDKQAKNLDAAAVRMANALVAAVKKALGIHSPSRVFQGLGDNVIKGLAIGLDDTYVKRSGAVLASSLEKGFGTPALEAWASQGASQATQGSVRVTLTAQQMSQLQRGREIQADLDAYRAAGGRSRA